MKKSPIVQSNHLDAHQSQSNQPSIVSQTNKIIQNSIAITIDDGINPDTMKLIEQFEKRGHKVTIFPIGNKIITGNKKKTQDNLKVITYLTEIGTAIGNHTFNHKFFNRITLEEAKKEIKWNPHFSEIPDEEVVTTSPEGKKYFRYPGGIKLSGNDAILFDEFLSQQGYIDVGRNVDSRDRSKYTGLQEMKDVFATLKKGDILLLHDIPNHKYIDLLLRILDDIGLQSVSLDNFENKEPEVNIIYQLHRVLINADEKLCRFLNKKLGMNIGVENN